MDRFEEKRISDAIAYLVKAYRGAKELSDKMLDVFGDDGGLMDVHGFIHMALSLMAGEENRDLQYSNVYYGLNSGGTEESTGIYITNVIKLAMKERGKEREAV